MKFVLQTLEKKRELCKSIITDQRAAVDEWKRCITEIEEQIAIRADELFEIDTAIEKLKA